MIAHLVEELEGTLTAPETWPASASSASPPPTAATATSSTTP